MTASTISIGLPGGKDFATPEPLRPAETLVVLLDSAADADGAFGRRQNDVRAALDGDGRFVLLVGPGADEGLATQFGCWIRAKIGLDIRPWPEPRPLVEGGNGYAAIHFFGDRVPDGAEAIARSADGELAGVRFRGGAAEIVVAPVDVGDRRD